LLAWDYFDNQ
jgi:hypothetical protein